MLRSSISLLAAVWALGGCATGSVQLPSLVVAPGTWSEAVTSASARNVGDAAAGVQAASRWWKEMQDGELDRVMATCLRSNADLGLAAARLQQARALADGARAARRPRLDFGAGAARERVPRSSVRDTDGTRVRVPAYRQSRFTTELEVSYEVDLLGRLALGQRAGEANLAASESDWRAVKQWLAQAVVLEYGDLRIADERSFDARRSEALLQQLLAAEHDRLRAGLGTREAVRSAERQLADRRDERIGLERDRHQALSRLAILMGTTAAEVQLAPREGYFAQLGISGAVAADLPAAVIEQRADVAAAWQRVVASGIDAERIRLDRYPALTLTGSTGFVSQAVRRWLAGDALAWAAEAALQVMLLDGGRALARSDQAISVMSEHYAEYRKTVLQALGEVEISLSAAVAARSRLAFAVEDSARREADLDAARSALAAGIGSRPLLLQAELALTEARGAASLRRHELLGAWAATQKALGR